MRKTVLLLLVFMAFSKGYSQEVYFLTGSNFTKYDFKSRNGSATIPLHSGTGSTYEIGYTLPLENKKFSYSVGFALNEYNALAGSLNNSYQWQTKYIGLQNALLFTLYEKNNFQFVAKGGVNLSGILYGKQDLNGMIYDLKNQDEFSGLIVIPFVGLQTKYKLKDYGYLSLGYSWSKSMSPFKDTQEKLSFTTNQILFGIHFNINNK